MVRAKEPPKFPGSRWIIVDREESIRRFLAQVDFQTDGCWLWIGPTFGNGYGQAHVVGLHETRAHRIMWRLLGRSLTKLQKLLHTCDVRRCLKPQHLWIGTQKQNVKDAMAKGRHHIGITSSERGRELAAISNDRRRSVFYTTPAKQ